MGTPELTDIELLQRIKADDAHAFHALFDRYWERLYLFAWKRLRSKQEAEDVVQHIFMKIWEHRAARNITYSLQSYLYQSVSYEVIAAMKRMLERTADISLVNENILPVFNNVLENMTAAELDRLIEAQICLLPERMQLVFRLRREENLSIREIAKHLDISPQTAKNQLTLALGRLQKMVSEAMLLFLLLL